MGWSVLCIEPDDVLWRALMVETRVKSQDCCRCSSLRPRTIQLDGPPRAGAYRQGKPCAIMCFPMSDISNEVDWIEKIRLRLQPWILLIPKDAPMHHVPGANPSSRPCWVPKECRMEIFWKTHTPWAPHWDFMRSPCQLPRMARDIGKEWQWAMKSCSRGCGSSTSKSLRWRSMENQHYRTVCDPNREGFKPAFSMIEFNKLFKYDLGGLTPVMLS